jgi:glycerol-3-phosphate dehydrogenase (NAD(P)+)
MKVTVIGCGRWGSCIAWYLDRTGHDVTVYGIKGTPEIEGLIATRKNSLLALPESIKLTTDINCAKDGEVVVISIPSQALSSLAKQLKELGLEGKSIVLCMKGIEISSGKRLSEIVTEQLGDKNGVAVWVGPGHVQEFTRGIPNCMVIDSTDDALKEKLVNEFSSDLIRFYFGTDLIGNEIGAAAKNVIGIAAGMLDGMGLTSLKGALMSRGTREVARLIKAAGGNELSAYGLCHLGDYEATVFSQFSHNRAFGEKYVKGEKFESLAEGYYTVKALMNMADKYSVELPICHAVYSILYEGADTKTALNTLFARTLKSEF